MKVPNDRRYYPNKDEVRIVQFFFNKPKLNLMYKQKTFYKIFPLRIWIVVFTLMLGSTSMFSQKGVLERLQFDKLYADPHEYSLFGSKGVKMRPGVSNFTQYVSTGTILTLDNTELQRLMKASPQTISLKLPDDLGQTLELYQAEVFTPDFKVIATDGRILTSDDLAGEMLFYRGIIKGDENSIVSVSLMKDEILISYSDKDGDKRIQKGVNDTYIAYNKMDRLNVVPYICGNDKDDNDLLDIQDFNRDQILNRSESQKCATVLVVIDYTAYVANNSNTLMSIKWMAKIWNEVITLYAHEGVLMRVSNVVIHTSTSNFPYSGNYNTLHDGISQAFNSAYGNSSLGDFKHMMITRFLGGGVAFQIGGGCDKSKLTCVSSALSTNVIPLPDYSWNIEVIAHEMGHNWGLRHTH